MTIDPAPSRPTAAATEDPPVPFLNREVQWLEFNQRVLAQAQDERLPLLERVRFLSIFSSNLDEFFMKRVGGLRRQIVAGVETSADSGMAPDELLTIIRSRVLPLTQLKGACFREQILPALAAQDINLRDYVELDDMRRREVDRWYQANVFPLLTPLSVDPGHRFPFISNLSVSLGILLRREGHTETLFARLKIPEVVPQWFRLAGTRDFVSIVDVVQNNLAQLFTGMEILEVLPFRVTRNADVEGDEEDAEDLLSEIQQQLRDRRFAPVVRMQVNRRASPRLLDFLRDAMELDPRDIYETSGLIDYRSLEVVASLPDPELHFRPWSPVVPPRLHDKERSIFDVIAEGDLLVHHPYESFDDSVARFVSTAANDPDVLGIKQALYRTSGDSPFVHALIRAAEAGKQVAVLVELRARFDEARNIHWAQKLEDAGVHVTYGLIGLKTHIKTALVVRRENDRLRAYAHVGTGNYHSRTARLYDDLGLFTCDPVVTEDLMNLFNSITGRSADPRYGALLVAPQIMRNRFVELIEREIEHARSGRPAHIVAKMNQLQDRTVIEKLYEASCAGVPIDLVVRGFCTLRPGVPGMSDNIRVTSIIGRYLEHSRIFFFRNGCEDPLDGDIFIGSADWMYRNLNARVEAICPVTHRQGRERLHEILDVALRDHRLGWDLQGDGRYLRRDPDGYPADSPEARGVHDVLMERARARE